MFDTHCHLNFKAYKKILPDVISRAQIAGVTHILIPGTDVKTSYKAVEIALQYEHFYAAVGIHPHHAYKILTLADEEMKKHQQSREHIISSLIESQIADIETLLNDPKVKAVGEVGMDRHVYKQTVYGEYAVNDEFIHIQKEFFKKQIKLAISYDKSLIIHNREAKQDLLPILKKCWDEKLRGRSVFHCCEPDDELLNFVKEHGMYMGIDGDITYSKEKQEFIKKVPIELLVFETDAPFLLPEPLRSQKKYPNEPRYLSYIVDMVSQLTGESSDRIVEQTSTNAMKLFSI